MEGKEFLKLFRVFIFQNFCCKSNIVIHESPKYLKRVRKRRLVTKYKNRGVHVVMVIVVGNGQGDTSSNPGRDLLHFT